MQASDLTEDAPLQFLKEEAQGACCLVPLSVLQRPVALLLAGGVAPPQSSIGCSSQSWPNSPYCAWRISL